MKYKFSSVEVREIAAAYEKKVGHRIGKGQIYRVLRRHGWRKGMPRSKHPKKADEEAIAASKKLTHDMNVFLKELSAQYPEDMIMLCCDGAAWHKAGFLCI